MRVITQVCQLENSSVTKNETGNTSEDDEQVKVENNKREEKEKETKENEDGWMKPLKFMHVMHFHKKK